MWLRQQFWLLRDALAPYKSPQSIYLSTPLSSYSILFYWAEEDESSLSRISLVWQRTLEKQAEPLSSKWKGSLRWKLPSNQVTDIYLIPSVAGLSLKLPKSTLISLDPSKRWTVMAFNQRRLWFLKTSANTEISACGTVTYSCVSVAEDENAARILTMGGKPGEGSYEGKSWCEFWGKTRVKKGATWKLGCSCFKTQEQLHSCLGRYIWRWWVERRREEKYRQRGSQVVCSIQRRKGRLLRARTSKEDLRWHTCPLCTYSDFNWSI